ncbi:MAG: exosortase-associated EpsI family protein [Planctomycetota bacterium]|jgi:hypothetical protein
MFSGKDIVSIVRSLFCVRFIAAVLILITAATGLRPGIRALANHYAKKSIAIRKPLRDFDISNMPTFRDGWEVTWEKASTEIGTNEYLGIRFVKKKSNENVGLSVTYYSDPRDKVAHTPDICDRQAGAVVVGLSTITLDTPELGDEYNQIPARLLLTKRPSYNIAKIFFFLVEGKFRYDRQQVRLLIGKPGNHYTYFAKIEVAVTYGPNESPDKAVKMCKQVIHESLPPLLAEHFPTKEQIKRP